MTAPHEPFTGRTSATDCSEDGPDGMLDLTLKFSAHEIVQAFELHLGRELQDREEIPVTVAGNLVGGEDCLSTIHGEDVIVILNNKQN